VITQHPAAFVTLAASWLQTDTAHIVGAVKFGVAFRADFEAHVAVQLGEFV
jgi:hypothetical protein